MKLNNPFVVRGYCGQEYFCDRVAESEKIVSFLENEGDVTLIAPRRYGKTGLIQNVFEQLPKDVVCIYLDIYATSCLADFSKAFVAAVVGSLDAKVERAFKRVAKFFTSCRPTVTPQRDGLPKFSFDIVPENAEASLGEAFAYLKEHEKRVVIAIDEFQQVLEYPEKGTEALLRSYVQFLPSVHFIFAGSRQHLMREMFLSAKHPFYQSTDIVNLDVIPCEKYRDFAAGFFQSRRKPFDATAFDTLYARFDGITWYVQMILRKLWADGCGLPNGTAVENAVADIVDSRRQEYYDLFRMQNESSRRLLKALAAAGPVVEPMSGAFVSQYALRAASSVSSALADLESRDLVYRTPRGYVVYDRFFWVWLKGV